MKKEIETKVLDIDREDILRRLSEDDLDLVCERRYMKTIYYKVEEPIQVLRIRSTSSKHYCDYDANDIEVTIKRTPAERNSTESNVKELDEQNLIMTGYLKDVERFFEMQGYQECLQFEKWRTSYTYKKCRLEFDEFFETAIDSGNRVVRLPSPPWLEIEGGTQEDISEVLSDIGLNWEDTSELTTIDLYKKYYGE